MKKGLMLIGSIGLGAGLMYLFDPTHGKQHRTRARTGALLARYRMEDILDGTAQAMRHGVHRATAGSPPWPVRVAIPRRMRMVSRRRRPRKQSDRALLLLACLGLGTVAISLVRAAASSRQTTSHVATTTLRDVYDWVCGMMTGSRT